MRQAVIAIACISFSCTGNVGESPRDGGTFDAGAFDAGAFDGGTFDGGTFDGGTFDGGTFDGGTFDAGTFDAGTFDAGTFDAGTFDAGTFDAGTFDAGTFDGGRFDGGTFDGGTFDGDGGIPGWVSALTPGGPWTELSGSSVLQTWLEANATPATGYVGSMPLGAVRDAYVNPIFDARAKRFALFGGGHFAGSFNGVVVFDAATLSYSLPIAPTPPTKYPPLYVSSVGADLTYPQSPSMSLFQTSATLSPLDAAYALPWEMPNASHLYSAASFSDGIFIRYYLNEFKADVNLGRYVRVDRALVMGNYYYENRYGTQLHALNSNIAANVPIQPGSHVVRDWSRGKDWLTIIPGDLGDNWRNHLARIDKNTSTIEALVGAPESLGGGASTMCIAGDFLYVFTPTVVGPYGSSVFTYDHGFRLHLDTLALERFRLEGTPPEWTHAAAIDRMETVPAFASGHTIRLWNYGMPGELDAFSVVDLTPTGGSGTEADPFKLTVTREVRPTSSMPMPVYTYALDFIPEWGVVLMLPSSQTRWWAMKL